MINTVLFDFDGTIMDTNEIIIQSWQTTFRKLRGREEDRAVLLGTFGEALEDTMRGFFPDIPLEKGLEIYRGFQRSNFLNNISLFPGIRELLEKLRQKQVTTALVTSRLRFTTEQALDKFDLNKYFDYVVTADDVTRHKPDPQSINIALEHLGSLPEESLMLGDTIYDIQCARNAGVMPVVVSWSYALSKELEADFPSGVRPDHIIDEPAELLNLI